MGLAKILLLTLYAVGIASGWIFVQARGARGRIAVGPQGGTPTVPQPVNPLPGQRGRAFSGHRVLGDVD